MEIIDATWEKRNLNVVCKEVIIGDEEPAAVVMEQLNTLQGVEYIVVKIPVGRVDVMQELGRSGFCFMEGVATLSISPDQCVLPLAKSELNSKVTYCETENLPEIYARIREGIFTTDRIYLDSFFTREQAAQRYVYWMEDEVRKGSQAYEIRFEDQPIGFFILKEQGEKVYYPFLIGIYPESQHRGLGFSLARKPLEEVLKRGGNRVMTCISINNPYCLRVHLQQGFLIDRLQYVFVKHVNKECDDTF